MRQFNRSLGEQGTATPRVSAAKQDRLLKGRLLRPLTPPQTRETRASQAQITFRQVGRARGRRLYRGSQKAGIALRERALLSGVSLCAVCFVC